VQSARTIPVWIVCLEDAKTEALEAFGVEILRVGAVDVALASKVLGAKGLTRVLVEGGSEIAAALLEAGLVDRLSLYRAGKVLGDDSRSAVAALRLEKVDFAPRFSLESVRVLGADTLETWHRGA
jgi:diaminohydroxyphosphoribosylaminopyrimidine deaminase/5-amino-6-(5-phosphoribosylamino)uracil reductase